MGTGGHTDANCGSFQVWRQGRWLARNDIGYGAAIAGWQGAVSDVSKMIAQNGIVYNGLGPANAYADGPPVTTRLQSSQALAYAAVDLSKAYRAHGSPYPRRDDNPYEASTVREFLFVKPMGVLVILDRVVATADGVSKTFLLHTPRRPAVKSAPTVSAVNGAQELLLTTLLPAAPSYNVVDESAGVTRDPATAYQFRLEITDSGAAQGYFLNVLQARSVGDPDVTAALTDSGTSWTLHLDSPALGHAVIVLNKGAASAGGRFDYSPSGVPKTATPLIDHVQGMRVTAEGPVWGA
jgi:hypothetical protein